MPPRHPPARDVSLLRARGHDLLENIRTEDIAALPRIVRSAHFASPADKAAMARIAAAFETVFNMEKPDGDDQA